VNQSFALVRYISLDDSGPLIVPAAYVQPRSQEVQLQMSSSKHEAQVAHLPMLVWGNLDRRNHHYRNSYRNVKELNRALPFELVGVQGLALHATADKDPGWDGSTSHGLRYLI
jgi:hypothetical protein